MERTLFMICISVGCDSALGARGIIPQWYKPGQPLSKLKFYDYR